MSEPHVTPWPLPPKESRGPGGGCAVSGRVIDSSGKPVRNATIYCVPPEYAGRTSVPGHEPHDIGQSGVAGEFIVVDLPPGPCALAAGYHDEPCHQELHDGASSVACGSVVVLDPRSPVRGVEIRLPFEAPPYGEVEVSFIDPEGTPVPEVAIQADGPSKPGRGLSLSDPNGLFWTPLPAGDCTLRVLESREFLPREERIVVHPFATTTMTVRLQRKTPVDASPSLFPPGRVFTVSVHVHDDAGAPLEGATVSIAHDGRLSKMESLKTGPDGRLRREVRIGKVDPAISVTRFFEYGRSLHWSRMDRALRTWDLHVVLERNTEVRMKPVDASNGRSIPAFTGTIHVRTQFLARPEIERQWKAAEVRNRRDCGDETFCMQPGLPEGHWIPPGSTDLEISALGYETARLRVEIPRQRTPFELAVPLKRRAT